jgi:RNA polymerase sigma factor (sigma-70 family)
MEGALRLDRLAADQDRQIVEVVERERARLRNFVRRRVADVEDAEDILQDVFSEFVETYRLMKPVEQAAAWLYRVARNRIIDLFRKRRSERATLDHAEAGDLDLESLLPSRDAGPDALYVRGVLIEELEEALAELPEAQRFVFIAHEIEGRSFKELADETGVGVNTLLSRKRYAVLHLRRRLQAIHDEILTK